MIYVWDNGEEYDDHRIAFIRSTLSREAFEALAKKVDAGGLLVAIMPPEAMLRPDLLTTIWVFSWRVELDDYAALPADERAVVLAEAERLYKDYESRLATQGQEVGARAVERRDEFRRALAAEAK